MFFKVVGRLTARFFRSLGKLFYTTGRESRRHPIYTLLTLLVVVGIGVLLYTTDAFGLTNGTFLGGNSGIAQPTEFRAEPDGRSNDFLNALKAGKAGDMYNLLSADYVAGMKKRGVTSAAQAQTLMSKRLDEYTPQPGGRLKYNFIHVENVAYSDGSTRDQFNGTVEGKDQKDQFVFLFTIKNGKINDIVTNEPVTVATLAIDKSETKDKPQPGTINGTMSSTAANFMVGLTTFDVDKVWNSLADSYKDQLSQQKVTKDTMAKIFNDIKSINTDGAKTGNTFQYGGFAYAQTISFPNGTSLNNFESVLTVNANASQPGYHILLDADNKIIAIGNFNAEDRILSALLGRGQPQQ